MVDTLDGVKLGMSQLDVQLAKGKPTDSEVDDDGDAISVYSTSEGVFMLIVFRGDKPDQLKAAVVCEHGGYSTLLGLGKNNSEQDVLKKLGPPTSTSVHAAGLSKLISYAPYKVGYEIEKGQVQEVCISSTGKVSYGTEYGKSDSPKASPSK